MASNACNQQQVNCRTPIRGKYLIHVPIHPDNTIILHRHHIKSDRVNRGDTNDDRSIEEADMVNTAEPRAIELDVIADTEDKAPFIFGGPRRCHTVRSDFNSKVR